MKSVMTGLITSISRSYYNNLLLNLGFFLKYCKGLWSETIKLLLLHPTPMASTVIILTNLVLSTFSCSVLISNTSLSTTVCHRKRDIKLQWILQLLSWGGEQEKNRIRIVAFFHVTLLCSSLLSCRGQLLFKYVYQMLKCQAFL